MVRLRIGTRGSELALWQARHIAAMLGGDPEIVVIKTEGDIIEGPLNRRGGKGLFVKAIEEALLAREVDIAVHSLKDMPSELPAGLVIGAVPERANASDVLAMAAPGGLAALAARSRVGTGSLRRTCQLRSLRPDLEVVPLRGNVTTRLRKMREGHVDGVVLARAGLVRLGLFEEHWESLPLLPAVGQGAIAVECRAGDEARVRTIEHAPSRVAIDAERAFLARLEGGCQAPIAGHASLDSDTLSIDGLVGSPDGTRVVRGRRSGEAREAAAIGLALAEELLARGAAEILRDAQSESAP